MMTRAAARVLLLAMMLAGGRGYPGLAFRAFRTWLSGRIEALASPGPGGRNIEALGIADAGLDARKRLWHSPNPCEALGWTPRGRGMARLGSMSAVQEPSPSLPHGTMGEGSGRGAAQSSRW